MVGVLGTGLEVFCCSSRQGAKKYYQNWIYIIPYQAYVYIRIYCNQIKPIYCYAHILRGAMVPQSAYRGNTK